MLVHRWGPTVVEMLRQTGGMRAAGVVMDLWIEHYRKMDYNSKKVTLLAMGKLLEARIRVVATRAVSIAQCCNVTMFTAKSKNEKVEDLEQWIAYVRKGRNLMDPTVLEAKQVKYYVSRCCELTLRAHSSDLSFNLEVPKMTRPSNRSGIRSANNSPVRQSARRPFSGTVRGSQPRGTRTRRSSSVGPRGSKTP